MSFNSAFGIFSVANAGMTRSDLDRKTCPSLFYLVFCGTVAMTFLTFAKELVMFQNSRHHWTFFVYLLAMRAYYPLLLLNLVILIGFALFSGWRRPLLKVAFAVFLLNVALFSANNVVNLLRGQPIHRVHHGIGW